MNKDISMGTYLVRVNGQYDFESSLEKFSREATAFIELQERDQEKLGEAIVNVFKNNPHATMNKPAVITLALGSVGFTPDTFNALRERAEDVIKNNDHYYTIKGAGGGLGLMDDEQYATWKTTGKNPAELARETKKASK